MAWVVAPVGITITPTMEGVVPMTEGMAPMAKGSVPTTEGATPMNEGSRARDVGGNSMAPIQYTTGGEATPLPIGEDDVETQMNSLLDRFEMALLKSHLALLPC